VHASRWRLGDHPISTAGDAPCRSALTLIRPLLSQIHQPAPVLVLHQLAKHFLCGLQLGWGLGLL
jgi:hypothetical protein